MLPSRPTVTCAVHGVAMIDLQRDDPAFGRGLLLGRHQHLQLGDGVQIGPRIGAAEHAMELLGHRDRPRSIQATVQTVAALTVEVVLLEAERLAGLVHLESRFAVLEDEPHAGVGYLSADANLRAELRDALSVPRRRHCGVDRQLGRDARGLREIDLDAHRMLLQHAPRA